MENQDNRLYLDKHYAVKMITPGMYNHNNVPLVVLDGLVETLNREPKLPHTMILILNDKGFWNNKDLLTFQMERILNKFFKEMHKIIDARKYALDDNAVNWDQPRILVTRPLPLPSNLLAENYPTGFRSNRRKFNKLLDNVKIDGKFTVINLNAFTSQNKEKLFNMDGSISEKGYDQIWVELSDCVQKEDEKQRIISNKVKAKQIAQELSVELMRSDDSDQDCMDSPTGKVASRAKQAPQTKTRSKGSPVRRSLGPQFDVIQRQSGHERSPMPSHTTASSKRANSASPANQRKHRKLHKQQQSQDFYRRRPRYYQGYPPFFQPQYHQHGFGPRYFQY